MPYVSVWVDEPSCDGGCDSADELKLIQSQVDEAISLLQAGLASEALDVLQGFTPTSIKPRAVLASQYKDLLGGKLCGFTTYGRMADT